MTVATGYSGDYVNATYGNDAGLRAAFQRVISLPPERSDNAGRIARAKSFATGHFEAGQEIRLLDIGAGLGVFPMRSNKQDGTARRSIPTPVPSAICGSMLESRPCSATS